MTNEIPVSPSDPKPSRSTLGCLSTALGLLAIALLIGLYLIVNLTPDANPDTNYGAEIGNVAGAFLCVCGAGYLLTMLPGLVLGIIALFQKMHKKAFAIAGVTLSGLALLPLLVFLVILTIEMLTTR